MTFPQGERTVASFTHCMAQNPDSFWQKVSVSMGISFLVLASPLAEEITVCTSCLGEAWSEIRQARLET